jgi:hypothetical protein
VPALPQLSRLSAAWIAALATLLVRGLIACSRLDELELELWGGSFARALLLGMPLDPERLPIIVHLRGSVLFGLLLAPLFLLLGPTVLAIKALAVGWSVATAALFAATLERAGGRAAGLAGALLFALAPPFFQKVDVLALGSHGDTLLPIWAALYWLIARRAGVPRRPLELAIAGFLLAFGAWFSMQFLVALPALLMAWTAAWWGQGGRPSGLFAAPGRTLRGALAFLLGALPPALAIPYVTRSLMWVNRRAEDQILPGGLAAVGDKLLHFLREDLARVLLFDDGPGRWAAWSLLSALAIGCLLTLPRLWRRAAGGSLAPSPLALFVLLHPLLFLGAYGATDFVVDFYNTLDGMGSRYLMPALPALLAWVALGVCRLVGRGQRPLAFGLLALAAVPGAAGVAALSDPLPGLRQPPVFGARPFHFIQHLEYASGRDPLRYEAWARTLDPNWPALHPLLYRVPLPTPFVPSADSFALVQAALSLRGAPAPIRRHQLAELGRQFVDRTEYELPYLLECLRALDLMHGRGKLDDEECGLLVHGAFGQIANVAAGRAIMARGSSAYGHELLAAAPAGLQPIAAEGLGFVSGMRWTPYERSFLENLRLWAAVPEALRERFFFALGLGYRQRFLESAYRPPAPGVLRIEAELPPAGLAAFRRALESAPDTWRFGT